MTQYVKSTSFASKDALPAGNPLKIVKGTEIDTEFNNIAIAVATKADLLNPVFTGIPTAATAATGTSTTQLATTAFATAAISPFTGSILMWPTATPPAGFLLCNGQTASRATYAALFAIVGTLFGVGDGSTTFTLPNYTDRMPIGAGSLYVANSIGGSRDASLPTHKHTATSAVTDPGHFHWQTGNNGPFTGGASYVGMTGASPITHNVVTETKFTGVTVATELSLEGTSATNANLPPYLGIFFIIKT
jgi:microcystin-dependent protein